MSLVVISVAIITVAVVKLSYGIVSQDNIADNCTCQCTNALQISNLRSDTDLESRLYNNALIAKFLALQDVPRQFYANWIFIESEISNKSGKPSKDTFSQAYGVSRFSDTNYPWTDILGAFPIEERDAPTVNDMPAPLNQLYNKQVDKDNIIDNHHLFWYKSHWWGVFSVAMNWENKTLQGKYKNELFVRVTGSFNSFMNKETRKGLGFDNDHNEPSGIVPPHIVTQFYDVSKHRFYASEYAHNQDIRNFNVLGNELMTGWTEIYYGEDGAELIPPHKYQTVQMLRCNAKTIKHATNQT